MNLKDPKTPALILTLIAMGLSVLGIAKPQWPIVAVAVLLLAVAMLIK